MYDVRTVRFGPPLNICSIHTGSDLHCGGPTAAATYHTSPATNSRTLMNPPFFRWGGSRTRVRNDYATIVCAWSRSPIDILVAIACPLAITPSPPSVVRSRARWRFVGKKVYNTVAASSCTAAGERHRSPYWSPRSIFPGYDVHVYNAWFIFWNVYLFCKPLCFHPYWLILHDKMFYREVVTSINLSGSRALEQRRRRRPKVNIIYDRISFSTL